MKPQPPGFFLKLFRWFCKPTLHPYLEGDLIEHFHDKTDKYGLRKARRSFAIDVIKLFRPGIIRSLIPQKLNITIMFRHLLVFTFRHFKKYPGTFLINLLGLTTALTTALLIFLWINDEASIDKFHEKKDRLYQIFLNEPTPNGLDTDSGTPVLLAPTLAQEFPEVEQAASVIPYEWFSGEKFVLGNGGDRFYTAQIQFATKDYFDIFSFDITGGNPNKLLEANTSVVISEELAQKLYNSTDVIGKTLQWVHEDYGGPFQITGVFKQPGPRSTQQFDAVFPFEIIKEDEGESWLRWSESNPHTYVTLKPGADHEQFAGKVTRLLKNRNEHDVRSLMAQPYADTYLYDQYENGEAAGGRILYLRLFGLIGLLILIIASINFTVMSTGRAVVKMKEIGIRKSMGAYRIQLALQYLFESSFVAMLASLLAILLTALFIPQFNELTQKNVTLHLQLELILYIGLVALFTGLLAGAYPALYLSGFNPVRALRGQMKSNTRGRITRKSLMIFQFSISTILIIGVLIVSSQIDLIQTKDLGFEKENRIWFTMGTTAPSDDDEGLSPQRIEAFLQLVKNTPGVQNTSNFAHNVLGAYGTTSGLSWQGKAPETQAFFAQIAGGYQLIETMGMEMLEGRSYSRAFSGDHKRIILNEEAVKTIGYSDPIGKKINLWGQDREIVGVVKNFHIDMLYEDIMPVFITLETSDFASQVMVKVDGSDPIATLDRIQKVYQDYFISSIPFEYEYLEDGYQAFYGREFRVGTFIRYATTVALFLTCLGLISFASFMLNRRLKEIAIRKVLGSSPGKVLMLLLSGFLKITVIASVIAIPVGYLLSKNWLDNFAYHINLELWYFLVAALASLAITIITVGFQTIRATRTNAVKHLSLEQ